MNKDICRGCGIEIQSTNKDEVGYLPNTALKKVIEAGKPLYCQRCFRLTHYGEFKHENAKATDVLELLDKMKSKKALVVMVIDLFAFSSSVVKNINKYLHGKKLLVIGNKVDLFPKKTKYGKIEEWVHSELKHMGVVANRVVLSSAYSGYGAENVIEVMDELRDGNDIIFIGTTNVGKSSMVNCLLYNMGADMSTCMITTSAYPNTTIGLIETELPDGAKIIDTPGIFNKYQYQHHLSHESLVKVEPRKPLIPKVFQLASGQTVFVGALLRFDYLEGFDDTRIPFTFNFNNELNLHRTKTTRADELWNDRSGELLTPPTKEELDNLGEFATHKMTIKYPDTDIAIAGIGWITINRAPVTIKISVPRNIGIYKRRALI